MKATARPLRNLKARRLPASAKRDALKFGGQHIVDLLNRPSDRDGATERVAWLVEAVHRVFELNESILFPSGFGPGKGAQMAEAARICAEMSERLSKFKYSVAVLNLPMQGGGLRAHYQLDLPPKKVGLEALAATWITSHLDTVHLIRRCRQCPKWFFAVTDHQKYCSTACRKRDASQGESFKEKRARYMRETYRPRVKREEAASKQQVDFSKTAMRQR